MFAEQREILINRQDELKRERGAALLEGRGQAEAQLDKELARITREIDVIDYAVAEETRRARAAALEAEETRRTSLRVSLIDAESARLDAVARVETATAALASALSDALEASGEIARLTVALHGATPSPLAVREFEWRLSERLCVALSFLGSRRDRSFGCLKNLRTTLTFGAKMSSLEFERRQGARVLEPYLDPTEQEHDRKRR